MAIFILGVAVLAMPIAMGKPPVRERHRLADETKTLVNVDSNGLAIKGYDPVAYVAQNKAVKGDAAIALKVGPATYHFSSQANRQAFEKNPAKYTPAFGGYCGFGVADDHLAPVDPNTFQIVDGRLILQYNKDAMAMFNKDPKGNLAKADTNWRKLVEQHGK